MKRAFTLVELLVVVGIVGLLVAVLVPAILKGRRAAEDTAGTANLRSLSQVMSMYTESNGGAFLNPFGTGASFAVAHSVTGQDLDWDFTADAPELTTEGFAFYWYSYLAELDGAMRLRDEQFAPLDGWMKVLKKKFHKKEEARSGAALWPSSYLYSPTFWSSPSRYPGGPRRDATAENIHTQYLQGVAFPSQKVMMFERADFSQADRPGGADGKQGRSPAFNSPRSKVAVALVDGAVRASDMSVIYADKRLCPDGTVQMPDRPGLLIPNQYPDLNHGAEPGLDGGFPSYFWATTFGIEGRDLPN